MSFHNEMGAILIKKDKPTVISDIYDVAVNNRKVYLDEGLLEWLKYGRSLLEEKLNKNEVIYGVNTGFGGNANMIVPAATMVWKPNKCTIPIEFIFWMKTLFVYQTQLFPMNYRYQKLC